MKYEDNFGSANPTIILLTTLVAALALPQLVKAQDNTEELIERYLQYYEEDYEALENLAITLTSEQSTVIARRFLETTPKDVTDLRLVFPTLEVLPEELKEFPRLTMLSVQAHGMTDLTVLADMDQLEYLGLTGAKITSLNDIGFKPTLEKLYLEKSSIVKWDGLENFPNLHYFIAPDSQLSGIATLWKLPALTRLNLSRTTVSALEFSSTAECMVETLWIEDTLIEHLHNIDQCQSLKKLRASNTNVTSLEPFSGLGGLLRLSLNRAAVEQFGAIKGLDNLNWLDLGDTELQSLDGIQALPNLSALFLYGTKVEDLAPALQLENLKSLGISQTPAENSPLRPDFEAKGTELH